jgi:hypothetical protein
MTDDKKPDPVAEARTALFVALCRMVSPDPSVGDVGDLLHLLDAYLELRFLERPPASVVGVEGQTLAWENDGTGRVRPKAPTGFASETPVAKAAASAVVSEKNDERQCTATTFDRLAGQHTRCVELDGHAGHHTDGAMTWYPISAKAAEEAEVRGHARHADAQEVLATVLSVLGLTYDVDRGRDPVAAAYSVGRDLRVSLDENVKLRESVAQLGGMHRIERGSWAAAANLLGLGTKYEPEAIHDAVATLAARSSQNRVLYERAESERVETVRKREAMSRELAEALAVAEDLRARQRAIQASHESVWYWTGDGDEPGSLSCPVVMGADTLREMLAKAERVDFLEQSIRHVQDREGALHAQVTRQSHMLDTVRKERDRALSDLAERRPIEAVHEDCPQGHTGAKRVLEQETGPVERCLRCEACKSDYVRVNGRWFRCPPGTKKGPL